MTKNNLYERLAKETIEVNRCELVKSQEAAFMGAAEAIAAEFNIGMDSVMNFAKKNVVR